MSRLKTDIISEFSEKKRTGIIRKNILNVSLSQIELHSSSTWSVTLAFDSPRRYLRLMVSLFKIEDLLHTNDEIFSLRNDQNCESPQCTTFIVEIAFAYKNSSNILDHDIYKGFNWAQGLILSEYGSVQKRYRVNNINNSSAGHARATPHLTSLTK